MKRMPEPDETQRDAEQLVAELMNGASEADYWRAKLHVWRRTLRWDRADGPPPGEPGCLVPAELLPTPNGTVVARKSDAPRPVTTVGDVMAKFVADFERAKRAA
jgi:hypothetical protein